MNRVSAVCGLGAGLLSAAVIGLSGCNRAADQQTSSASSPAAPSVSGQVSNSVESLGEPVAGDVVPVCAACLSSDEKLGQTVAFEGVIIQQCPASGCWFRMEDGVGKVFVDLAPADLRLPGDRVGQRAKVTGRVVKQGSQIRLEAQHVAFTSDATAAPSGDK